MSSFIFVPLFFIHLRNRYIERYLRTNINMVAITAVRVGARSVSNIAFMFIIITFETL